MNLPTGFHVEELWLVPLKSRRWGISDTAWDAVPLMRRHCSTFTLKRSNMEGFLPQAIILPLSVYRSLSDSGWDHGYPIVGSLGPIIGILKKAKTSCTKPNLMVMLFPIGLELEPKKSSWMKELILRWLPIGNPGFIWDRIVISCPRVDFLYVSSTALYSQSLRENQMESQVGVFIWVLLMWHTWFYAHFVVAGSKSGSVDHRLAPDFYIWSYWRSCFIRKIWIHFKLFRKPVDSVNTAAACEATP
jgi:hypothetical protein